MGLYLVGLISGRIFASEIFFRREGGLFLGGGTDFTVCKQNRQFPVFNFGLGFFFSEQLK